MGIAFGTEGWRAIIAEEFTMENVRRVAQAIAEHVRVARPAVNGIPTVAVGYDTRFLSDRFAEGICEVLVANGLRAVLADRPVPTCAVSRYVVAHRLAGGVVVTASHNPPSYNGIKVKEAFGGSATPAPISSSNPMRARRTLGWVTMPCSGSAPDTALTLTRTFRPRTGGEKVERAFSIACRQFL